MTTITALNNGESGSVIRGKINTNFTNLNTGKVETSVTVNSKALTSNITLTQDDIGDGTTYKQYSTTDKSKLAGIEAGAEVNNISDVNATDLTDGGATTLHKHSYNNLDDKPTIPTALSELSDDATHRLVTDTEKSTWNGKQDALGFTAENVANKDTTVTLGTSDTKYPSQKAVKSYIDTGLGTKQGTITLTTTGTSGASTLIGDTLNIPQYTGGTGDVTASANITDNTIVLGDGGAKGIKTSSKTIVTTLGTDDTTVPTSKAVKDVTDGKVTGNVAITGATKTKITYDAKGLVTSGANATCDDIADGTNTHLVTTAQQTIINNTSNTNSGDNATNTQYNKFTQAESTASPNDTVYVDSLTANGASTNVDIAIVPKGTGAILANIPDGTTTGGNKRGANAVDLQTKRSANTQIASGANSIVVGVNNTASGSNDTAIGYANQSTGGYSTSLGYSGEASGIGSLAVGYNNVASGNYSTSMGKTSTASGANSVAIGFSNTASGTSSLAIGGSTNTAQSYGETVLGVHATVGAGNATSYVATDRLFVIGNGNGSASDALTILKNGNTTIAGTIGASNLSGTNTGDQVGDGVTITGAGTIADPFVSTGGGLTWGDSITSTSGTGITATIGNSASAGTIAYKGVIGNTQTESCTIAEYDLGTDGTGVHTGIKFKGGGSHNVIYMLAQLVSTTSSPASVLTITENATYYSDNSIKITKGKANGIFVTSIANADSSTKLFYGTLNDTQASALPIVSLDVGTSTYDHNTLYLTGTRHSVYMGDSDQAPGTPTNKLYSLSGGLYRNGNKLNGNLALTGGTLIGALNIEHADGIVLGKDDATNIAGKIKMFSAGVNAFYNTFTSGENTANATYTLPVAMPAVSGYQLACTDAGVMSWVASAGGFSWGATATAGTGTGLAMTSDAVGGGTPFLTMAHTASGTLTANTTTQASLTMSRTHTNASSVTDNYIGLNLSRTNIMNQAGGTLLAQGSILSISGTDTQTAGTLTPSYNLLSLVPSLRSTGSSINVTVASSVVTAPTNGHIYAVLGNTQTVAQTLVNIDTGTSTVNNNAINVKCLYTSNTATCGAVLINNFSSATQALGQVRSIRIGNNFNTNSTQVHSGIWIDNMNNSSSGYNVGLQLINNSTISDVANQKAGAHLRQTGVGGTTLLLTTGDNINSSTNGLVNYTLSNTQSGATVMQKIDSGTSTQAHTLLSLVNKGTGSAIAITGGGGTHSIGIGDSGLPDTYQANVFLQRSQASQANRTLDLVSYKMFRYFNGGNTRTDNFNMHYIERENMSENAGAVITSQGSVLKLVNISTQDQGTLSDVVNVLSATQSATITTGKLFTGVVGSTERFKVHPMVANSATNNAYLFDTTTSLSGTTTLAIFANAGATKVSIDNAGNTAISGRLTEQGTYANIYVADGVTAQTIATGATYAKLTEFTTDGLNSNCTSDSANDKITVTKAGKYLISVAWSGAVSVTNSIWDIAVFIDGTESNSIHMSRKFSSADIGAGALIGIATVGANKDIDVRVKHDNGGSVNMTTHDMSLSVTYLGE